MHELHNDLPFFPEKMKIEKDEKIVANLHDKRESIICLKYLKRALNHGLVLKKVHRAITFNQEAWLNPYINMKTELRKNAKNDCESLSIMQGKCEKA